MKKGGVLLRSCLCQSALHVSALVEARLFCEYELIARLGRGYRVVVRPIVAGRTIRQPTETLPSGGNESVEERRRGRDAGADDG